MITLFNALSSRARQYGQQLGAQEVSVIHFTLKEEDTEFQYPFSGVNVLHVWHNVAFSTLKVKYLDDKGTVQGEDIPNEVPKN